MANQTKGQNQSQQSKRPVPPASLNDETSEQDLRDMSQTQDNGSDTSDQTPDGVEIGDPVPEGDRTIRARGPGETGEDEDLPSDDGSVETPSERH